MHNLIISNRFSLLYLVKVKIGVFMVLSSRTEREIVGMPILIDIRELISFLKIPGLIKLSKEFL